jgi:hypothetical protein
VWESGKLPARKVPQGLGEADCDTAARKFSCNFCTKLASRLRRRRWLSSGVSASRGR